MELITSQRVVRAGVRCAVATVEKQYLPAETYSTRRFDGAGKEAEDSEGSRFEIARCN